MMHHHPSNHLKQAITISNKKLPSQTRKRINPFSLKEHSPNPKVEPCARFMHPCQSCDPSSMTSYFTPPCARSSCLGFLFTPQQDRLGGLGRDREYIRAEFLCEEEGFEYSNKQTNKQTPSRKASNQATNLLNSKKANMSDKNTSTLQSYIDSAAGAAQSVLGSVTGSTADKVFSPTISIPLSILPHCLYPLSQKSLPQNYTTVY
jgi:hypothetical protein